ncbi:UPF0158 family protein [Marivirga tractuosa]|uniref:UPF0158 family protein n=1 Tax=Marivirga tractuosa TaxID=1006 RepID=UPI0035D0313D
MALSEEHIEEIAGLLDCGLVCFYHKITKSIEYHPDSEEFYSVPEPWHDILDKIQADRNNYIRFEKMDSNQAFRVMENFAWSLTDIDFRDQILARLSKRKPFQHFKFLIDSSEYRQDWFDFKKKAYIEWVKEQI